MTPEKQIQEMIDSGELININDKVTMQIFDAQLKDGDRAVFQMIGYSSDLDAYVTTNYYADMSNARRFGEFLIGLADKYDPQIVEVVAEAETEKSEK